MEVIIEKTPVTQAERDFARFLESLPVIGDVRDHRKAILAFCKSINLNMVVGCGGSHLWIHRAAEFVEGHHTHPQNDRFAIIRE